ncbi:MAG: DUF2264 domain-containing protein [Verrucomicrobiota bacterium]|nr:DUF2264 domain-containing protein [Verrucomicrobiota bacterium]
MESRREFLKSVTALGMAGAVGATAVNSVAQTFATVRDDASDRAYWLAVLARIARPVLENLSRRQLKKTMPVEAAHPADRARYTHLEAFGRLLAGVAPWLAAQCLDTAEAGRQKQFIALAQASLDAATDPKSPDFMNFDRGGQALVDTAFLAEGILRAPAVLWEPLEPRVRRQIVQALKFSRAIATPTSNNWAMFAAMIEAALRTMGEPTIEERLEGCLRHMLGWYDGDGAYGDGEFFHWDYYNSFVIHPMLVDVLAVLRQKDRRFEPVYALELNRARRYAEILERLVAPDGTFPSLGRSTCYRFGAFQALAQIVLLRELPEPVKPAQARCALTAVMRKMTEAPSMFDDRGWLRVGFYGHQPSLAEGYISTGSLYLCSTALLPLGLPPADEFWSGPAELWTQQRIWSGQNLPADHALGDVKSIEVPSLHRSS